MLAAFDHLETCQDRREAQRMRLHAESGTGVALGAVTNGPHGVVAGGYQLTSVGAKCAAVVGPAVVRCLRRDPTLGALCERLNALRSNPKMKVGNE